MKSLLLLWCSTLVALTAVACGVTSATPTLSEPREQTPVADAGPSQAVGSSASPAPRSRATTAAAQEAGLPTAVTRSLSLIAFSEADPAAGARGSTVQDVRFVIVAEDGTVVGTRAGPGHLAVTAPVSRFWSGVEFTGKAEPIGEVTVFAYAPKYRRTIVFGVLVSASTAIPRDVRVPMFPLAQGARNEPHVALSPIPHLLIVGLADRYAPRDAGASP